MSRRTKRYALPSCGEWPGGSVGGCTSLPIAVCLTPDARYLAAAAASTRFLRAEFISDKPTSVAFNMPPTMGTSKALKFSPWIRCVLPAADGSSTK